MNNTNNRFSSKKVQKNLRKDRSVWKSCFALIIIIIITIIGIILFAINYYKDSVNSPNSSSTDSVSIVVTGGDNLNSLAKNLEEKGVIKSELILRVYLKTNNISPGIKPGTYNIAKNLTLEQVIAELDKGTQKQGVGVTLIEGMRYEKSAEVINNAFQSQGQGKAVFDKSLFLQICNNPDKYSFSNEVQTFLNKYKPAGKPLRGFIYPDTYRFDMDYTSQQVIEIIISNFNKRLIENNVPIDNVTLNQSEFKTFYSALSLASIIQKESGKASDDFTISGIFHNRLADNYPLQSDATINFALNSDNPLSTSDTTINSPYNTYVNFGLTPTPIDEPGIPAIISALKPQDTKYYFFVYDKVGNVYYAKTFNEHQRNIYKHKI